MIKGTNVTLMALDSSNSETVRAWVNDPRVNRYMLSGHVPVTALEEQSFYHRMAGSETDHVFEIHVDEDDALIGHVGLHGVDLRHRTGEIGIMIGDLSRQNRGYGRDAIETVMRYAFDTLGLNRVEIRARVDNERALYLYRSMGFTDVGLLRQTDFAEGRFFDLAVLDMLVSEYRGSRPVSSEASQGV